MISNTKEYKSHDNKLLVVRSWFLDQTPKAIIILIHGIGEHSGRYQDFANTFLGNNIFVFSIDYRGHGLSGGKRGYIESYENLRKDIDVLFNHVQLYYKNIPLVFYGHSMGGNICLNYYINRLPLEINLLIISSPWIELTKKPSTLLYIFSKIANNISPSFITKVSFSSKQLTKSEKTINDYKEDKLNHKFISARLFIEMQKSCKFILSNAYKINIPILLMHGSKDSITSTKGSIKLFEKLIDFDKEIKIWDGFYHELHNEPENKLVFNKIINWINTRT